MYCATVSSKWRSSGVSYCVFPSNNCTKYYHWAHRQMGTSEDDLSLASPTLGWLVFTSMMKFHSFPFRLCATLYFLTNARLSVADPLPGSPPRAPWVMTPRTILGTPRSTWNEEWDLENIHRKQPRLRSLLNCYLEFQVTCVRNVEWLYPLYLGSISTTPVQFALIEL